MAAPNGSAILRFPERAVAQAQSGREMAALWDSSGPKWQGGASSVGWAPHGTAPDRHWGPPRTGCPGSSTEVTQSITVQGDSCPSAAMNCCLPNSQQKRGVPVGAPQVPKVLRATGGLWSAVPCSVLEHTKHWPAEQGTASAYCDASPAHQAHTLGRPDGSGSL